MGREKFPCARQSRPQNPRYPCSAERENEKIFPSCRTKERLWRRDCAHECCNVLRWNVCARANFNDLLLLSFSRGRIPPPRQVWNGRSQPGLFSCLVLHLEQSKSGQSLCGIWCYHLHCCQCRCHSLQKLDRNVTTRKLHILVSSPSSWMVQVLLCCGVKIWTHWKWQGTYCRNLKRNI